MAFAHSAYSTMGTNLAREVLMAKTMPQLAKQMPQLNKIIKNRKRAKTSAHSQNVNLQVESDGMSSSDFEEDADTLEGGEQQRGGEPGAKPAWECPGEGCVRRLEIGDEFGNKKWPTYKAKQDGTFWPAPSWWWLCYDCHKKKKDAGDDWKSWNAPVSFVPPSPNDHAMTEKKRGEGSVEEIMVKFMKNRRENPVYKFKNLRNEIYKKDMTAFDLKQLVAMKWALPCPKFMNDSKSRMLRLQCKQNNSWEMVEDETLLKDRDDCVEWQFEMKAMKLDKDSFINMLLSQDGLMSVYQTFGNYRFKGKGHERADLRLLMTKYEEWTQKLCPVLGFDDCLEKIESVGNSVRVQGALEMLRELEAQNHLPKEEEETTESAARRLSDEMDDEAAGIAVEEAAMAEDAGGDGQELVVAGGEVGNDKGEDDEIFEAAEEFNEDDFVDEGDEYAEMEEEEDHVVRPAPAAAAIAALRSVSIDAALPAAAAEKQELTAEQKERIDRNRQIALDRKNEALKKLAERDAVKAAEATASSLSGAAAASPTPSAPASRGGSPRRSSSRAPTFVVVTHSTPSMERLAAKKAATAADAVIATTSHSGAAAGASGHSAAGSAAVSVTVEAVTQSLPATAPVVPHAGVVDVQSSPASKRRGTGPSADEQMETEGGDKHDEMEEEEYPQEEEDDFEEDAGAAYVETSQIGLVLATAPSAPASASSAVLLMCSPQRAKSPVALSSVSPVSLMPLGSQASESPAAAAGSADAGGSGGGGQTLQAETLVYDDGIAVCDGGTLVYNALEPQLVEGSAAVELAALPQEPDDDLGLVDDFV